MDMLHVKKVVRVGCNDVLRAVNRTDALLCVFLGVIRVFQKIRELPNVKRQ